MTVPSTQALGKFQESKKLDALLAPSSATITSNSIQIGSRLARTLFVATYPRYLNTNWFSPIINLDRELDIAIYVTPENSAEMLKKLRDRLGKLQAQIIEEESSGKVRDPKLETAVGDIEALRDELQQGTDRFFRVGIYITIFGDTVKDLDEAEHRIKGTLDGLLVYTKQATFLMKEGYLTTMPLNTDNLDITNPLNTEPLSSMFPFVSFDLSSDKGILYGINQHNNSLVLFDRFSMENANSVILGKSGGGKSYAVKLEILRSLMFGTQVYVLDPENEYKYLADTVGGTSIKISVSSDSHINPFDIPHPRPDETAADALRSHIVSLIGLFRLIYGQLTPVEENLLDEAIRQTYALKDITADSDFSNAVPPLLSDFEAILNGIQGAESLVVRLQRYTQGSFAGFLNNPTNVNLDNQLVVFSIRDMEDELRPIAMYVVLNYIWTQIRIELKQRLLIVDEAWWLMRFEAGGAFLFDIAKRARKYYLGLSTISQDIPDFMNSSYGKPIVTNSSIQLLLKQSPASIDVVQQTFNLTDSEKFFLLEAQVGHGLFFAGQNHIAIRIISSYPEDQIITSDPKQILEIEAAKKELESQ